MSFTKTALQALIALVNPKIQITLLQDSRNGLVLKITKTRLATVTSATPKPTNANLVVHLVKVFLSLSANPNVSLPPLFVTPAPGLVTKLPLVTEQIKTHVKLVVKTIFTLVPLTLNAFHPKVEAALLRNNASPAAFLTTTLLPILLVTTVDSKFPKGTSKVNGMLPSL